MEHQISAPNLPQTNTPPGSAAYYGVTDYGAGRYGTGAFDTAGFDPATFDGSANALREPLPASPPYVEPTPDAFEQAAREALENPDPAVEREIFESAFKDETNEGENDRHSEAELKALPITLVNNRGERVAELAPNPNIESKIFAPVNARKAVVRARQANPSNEGQSTSKAVKSRRMRTVVGRAARANNVTILLSIPSLALLTDEKLTSLRDERPNDPDAQAARDAAIAHYEEIKQDLEALRGVAIAIKQGNADENAATKVANSFTDGIRKTWEKRHEDICTKVLDATLFVSCIGLCSLFGCAGTAAVAVSGTLVGGRPVIDALKSLPKRLFK
jgi:hypothetical protein